MSRRITAAAIEVQPVARWQEYEFRQEGDRIVVSRGGATEGIRVLRGSFTTASTQLAYADGKLLPAGKLALAAARWVSDNVLAK